uniref:Uncharacterized protein n=1 Tax=Anguilla anguilla TaxID=7936 RepID=A0A0E9V832_ANGAN
MMKREKESSAESPGGGVRLLLSHPSVEHPGFTPLGQL